MTPGQKALAEAARMESARVYGRTQRQVDVEQKRVPAITLDEYDSIMDERRSVAIAAGVVIPFDRARAS